MNFPYKEKINEFFDRRLSEIIVAALLLGGTGGVYWGKYFLDKSFVERTGNKIIEFRSTHRSITETDSFLTREYTNFKDGSWEISEKTLEDDNYELFFDFEGDEKVDRIRIKTGFGLDKILNRETDYRWMADKEWTSDPEPTWTRAEFDRGDGLVKRGKELFKKTFKED